jgi:hypothetical protein
MPPKSGRLEQLPYSLSRWTDVPISKWAWLKAQLAQGWMWAGDPRTAVMSPWSLDPGDTLGLIFWTKNPENLLRDAALLQEYPWVVHITLTGWTEVEKGAPDLEHGVDLIRRSVEAFGPERVTWRFSPVPTTSDSVERFERIARPLAQAGLEHVYVAYIQTNDLMVESRDKPARQELLRLMSQVEPSLEVRLCSEDRTLDGAPSCPNLAYGVCEDGARFKSGLVKEDCGCALSVDPFTINETCQLGCEYCYAADRSLSPKKRNTTRSYNGTSKSRRRSRAS